MKCECCNDEYEGSTGTITCHYKTASGAEDQIRVKLCHDCYVRLVETQLDEIRTIYREKNK